MCLILPGARRTALSRARMASQSHEHRLPLPIAPGTYLARAPKLDGCLGCALPVKGTISLVDDTGSEPCFVTAQQGQRESSATAQHSSPTALLDRSLSHVYRTPQTSSAFRKSYMQVRGLLDKWT